MTSFRANKRLIVAGSVFLFGALQSGLALSQDKPRSLVPSLVTEQPGAGSSGQSGGEQPKLIIRQQKPASRVVDTKGKEGSLVVEQLDALNTGSVGTLGAAEGGLGADMWQGTPVKRVARLLDIIKPVSASPQMLDLYRRLLLTSAALPADPIADNILDIRLRKLQEGEMPEEALSLAGRIQERALTPDRKKRIAELGLLAGKLDQSCRQGEALGEAGSADPFWLKLDSFCQTVDEQFDKAELTVALLEEQGEQDPLFFALFARLAGDPTDVPLAGKETSPLHKAMIRQAELSAGEDTLASFTEQLEGLKKETVLDNKVAALLDIWSTAAEAEQYPAVTEKTLGILLEMPPADYGFDFNLEAVKILLLHKREKEAVAWERVIRRSASQGSNTERLQGRKNVTRLDAYMLLSGATGIARWNSGSFDDWLRAVEEDPENGLKSAYLVSMLEVLGYAITDDNWNALLDLPQPMEVAASNHALENSLIRAASAGRTGETVALALLALGEEGPAAATITTLTAVTSALKAVGLETEARAFTLEAAIARSL